MFTLCIIADLITCYMTTHRTREALACASEMCKKIHTCRSLTVSTIANVYVTLGP